MENVDDVSEFQKLGESLELTVEQEFRLAVTKEEIKGYPSQDLQEQYLLLYRLFLMKSNVLETLLSEKLK